MTPAIVRHSAGCVFGATVAIGVAAGCLGAHAQDATKPQAAPRMPQLNTLQDIRLALHLCWLANQPPIERAWPGMRMSLMLTFTRTGELQGEPRFTFVTREAPAETKALYERAAVASINACTPLPFTEALGNALAGRPTIKIFIEERNQKGT
jgi:hypothetical protein